VLLHQLVPLSQGFSTFSSVATSPVAMGWLCNSPRTGCARRTKICVWREQAIIEWSRRVISIVTCCHGAKLCAYAARDFRSQHKHVAQSINKQSVHGPPTIQLLQCDDYCTCIEKNWKYIRDAVHDDAQIKSSFTLSLLVDFVFESHLAKRTQLQ